MNSSREQIVAVNEHEMQDFGKRFEAGHVTNQGSDLSIHGHGHV